MLFTTLARVKNKNAAPKKIKGSAYFEILKPIMNDVNVVPILEPITIAIACFVFNNPAPTKLIVITIVPVLD